MTINHPPIRYPSAWRDLRPGEMMFTKRPLHRLELIREILAESGVIMTFEPAPNGYWIVCKGAAA